MSDQERPDDDALESEPGDDRTEVKRPSEPELSPGRLEEGTPESRPIDPKIGGPLIP